MNRDVLDYINLKGIEQGLNIDPDQEHALDKLQGLRPHLKRKLASHNCKKILQETILCIVDFYSNFNKLYFPVR